MGQESTDSPMENKAPSWLAKLAGEFLKLASQLKGKNAVPNEVVLTFSDDAAYARFLADAESAGLRIKNKLPALRAVEVEFDSLDALQAYAAAHPDMGASMAANLYVDYPVPPESADRVSATNAPLSGSALPYIGLGGNANVGLGQGLTIAILDSSVANIAALNGRLKTMVLANPPTVNLDHGTAVAVLAAGEGYGVLPLATILSIGVVGTDDRSDAFTLANGVMAAADNGARIINISLGSDQGSEVLRAAIKYAMDKGAVVVASAGNDGYTNSTYPARFEGVIAATATDAYGQITSFSNASKNYGFAAPGLQDASYNAAGELISFSGTSASAPLVAGSIGAVMSRMNVTAQQALEMLKTYADEGGAPGIDSDFGYGLINLDRVFNSTTPNRVDAAVASHYYNATAEGQSVMEYVIENRGNTPMYNWQLRTTTDGSVQDWALPVVPANEETVVRVPLSQARIQTGTEIEFQSRLTAPSGTIDAVLKNNGRASAVLPKAPTTSP